MTTNPHMHVGAHTHTHARVHAYIVHTHTMLAHSCTCTYAHNVYVRTNTYVHTPLRMSSFKERRKFFEVLGRENMQHRKKNVKVTKQSYTC